ncbi:hypothetical protein DH2020_019900 [Rehmannia glutinosa]|uniref:Dymeclin n=1 Tax=Rehmannia glutinosa TaxID=99300 RepID=A0ABR0WEK1_REHGL
MGGVPSTPRLGGEARPQETAEYLIGAFVGDKSFPLASDYWQKLLEVPLDLRWPPDRVRQACHLFALNNCNTRHLAKILIHLSWCLQECVSASGVPSPAFTKAFNALFVISVFLKNLIENAKSDNFEELYLSLDETEPIPTNFSKGEDVENLIMYSALTFIAKVDVSPGTYLLHHELLNFMLIAMSTQLLSGPSPGLNDKHPFIDAAMIQESSLVNSVVHKLLLNYIIHPSIPLNSLSYTIFSDGNQPGVLRRVGSAAANLMLLPFNYLASSTGEASRSRLAESSLNILLFLDCKFMIVTVLKSLSGLPAVNRIDIEGNAQSGPLVRLPFASLFDTLGIQDSSFNASIHKLMLPNVPWYQERLLHQTSLGSLMIIILIRTVKYNLSKLRDIYLHTNCLATLANMAPHVHRLSAYASQQLVSLFDMLSRKYNKLAEVKNDKMNMADGVLRGDSLPEDPSTELHIYTDFLRLVLKILYSILTYALPRNPEVLDFFNSRIDAQEMDDEWSVEKVLQVIINNCRSWRGEGLKLVLSRSGFTFNPSSINLFPVPVEDINDGLDVEKPQNGELKEDALQA